MRKYIFDTLHDVAETAPLIRHSRHAACILYRDRTLAVGVAQYKTHPLMRKYQDVSERVYLHAEVDAIVRTVNRYGTEILRQSALYVLRLTKGGSVSLSKPCEGCSRCISAFNIQEVYWST
jgi:deoxycytidylate deaminase